MVDHCISVNLLVGWESLAFVIAYTHLHKFRIVANITNAGEDSTFRKGVRGLDSLHVIHPFPAALIFLYYFRLVIDNDKRTFRTARMTDCLL